MELPSPIAKESLRKLKTTGGEESIEGETTSSGVDNLTKVYEDYITKNDPDLDNVFGASDNCPMIYNPGQLDGDNDGIGDECDLTPNGDEEETEIAATTTPKAVCDIDYLDLCDNESDCNSADGYWYNEQCNAEPVVVVVRCSEEYLNLCDKIECESLTENYIWESEQCIASTTPE